MRCPVLAKRGLWALSFIILMAVRAHADSDSSSRNRTLPDEAARLLANMDELQRNGRGREAITAGQEALRLARQALGTNHLEVGRLSYKLAVACVNVMDYKTAVACGETALRIMRAAPNRKPGDLAYALYALGLAENRLDRLQAAEAHLKEACEMCRTASGVYDEQSGLFWQALGDVYLKLGRYAEAEHYGLIGLQILDRNASAPPLQYAQALQSVGNFFMQMGDANRAEPYLFRNQEILQKTLPANDPRIADALDATGRMNRMLGEYDRATRCLEDSLRIRRSRADASPFGISQTLHLLARVYADRGDVASAYATQAEALKLIQDRPGVPPQTVYTALNNLGWYALGLSRLEEAQTLLGRSLAMAQRVSGADSEDAGNTQTSLACISCLRKNIPDALMRARDSDRIYTRRLAEAMKMGSEDQKQTFVRKIEGKTHLPVELHLVYAPDNAEASRFAFETILRRKGLVAEAVSTRQAEIRQSADSKTLESLRALATRRSELSHMALSVNKRLDREEAKRLWMLQRDIDNGVRELQMRFGESDGPPVESPTLERVRQALPPRSALLEYVTYKRSKPALSAAQRKNEPAECAVYVLLPDGRLRGQSLGSMSVIAPKIHALRREIMNPGTPAAETAARDLAVLILDPVLEQLKDVESLFISPDDVLHLVPFGMLPDGQGRMLLERALIVYLNSSRDLLVKRPAAVALHAPMIVAAADFDAEPDRTAARNETTVPQSGSGMLFGPLPGTARERDAIVRIMPGARTAAGAQATEEALKNIRSPAVLHIATHGFFLNERGTPAGEVRGLKKVAPTQPAQQEQALTPDFDIYRHPYLRSGLALAGANRFAASGDDGIVTAMEVADLDLRGTPLVVLSACETGVGEAVSGAGVFGLRRAFQEAGAATLVLSLWKVHDEATAEIMRLFYEELKRGTGRAAALRKAQLALRKEHPEWRHPFYWSAFIVSGDWRPCMELWNKTGDKQ
jgi:CHAT domain-containing protein